MDKIPADQAIFLTMVRSSGERDDARVLINSIRTFGGALSDYPIWLFEANPQAAPCQNLASANVHILPLNIPDTLKPYYFADKVFACAQAEKMAPPTVQSLIWIDPTCLVVKPPVLFDLGQSFDTAVRPVHIKNVGLLIEEPLDTFWQKIYATVGLTEVQRTVETFVGMQRIRAYFNSHAFAINPARGLLRQWLAYFTDLVNDEAYQKAACQDVRHRVFLHQAVWSALLVAKLDPQRICNLPPDYNYPYNLHQSVPATRRAKALNDLVCLTYEERSLDPAQVEDIAIHDPLKAWLLASK